MLDRDSSSSAAFEQFRPIWRLVTWAGLLGSIYYILCVSGAPRIKFLTELGATAFDFGLISGLGSFALVFQLLGGMLARRLNRRKPMWMVLALIHRLAFIGVLCAPALFDHSRWMIGVIIFFLFVHDAIAQTSTPLWMSWMADLVPQESITRYWASRQRFITLINIAIMILVAAGFHYYEVNDRIIPGFLTLAAVGVGLGVVDILLFTWVPEPPAETVGHIPWMKILVQPLRDAEFRPFLYFLAYWQFAVFFAAPFFGLYMVDHVKLSVLTVQLLGAVSVFGVAFASRFWGLVCDTYGYRPVLQILSFAKVFTPTAFFVIPNRVEILIPALIFVMFIDGVLNSGMQLSIQGVLLKTTPRANRTMYIAAANFLATGLMAGITPIFSGRLIDFLNQQPPLVLGVYTFSGYHAVFLISLSLRFFAFRLSPRIQENKLVPAKTVLRQIFSKDALRVTRLVYQLQESPREERRLDAARQLGQLRNPLAIVELIHRLRDGSQTVREAAAEALGLIGVAEATEPLAQALFSADAGIRAPAARALGKIGGVSSLKALLRNLRKRDPESLLDTIDSLARIGDDASIPPLIMLFHEIDDETVRRRIAAALGRITMTESIDEVVTLLSGRRADQLNLK